jgi:peptidoglycan-associated lipoprotein
MKTFFRISLAVLPVMFFLAGCSTTGETEQAGDTAPKADTAKMDGAMTAPATRPAAADATPMAEAKAEPAVDPLNDPNSMLAERTVYFDYDSYTVGNEGMNMIKAHAEYLANKPDMVFTLEGHADERGTREYNIALGERRADAVRRILMANGVSSAQINVISYGEERPAKRGHDESAWRYNRRAYFAY